MINPNKNIILFLVNNESYININPSIILMHSAHNGHLKFTLNTYL